MSFLTKVQSIKPTITAQELAELHTSSIYGLCVYLQERNDSKSPCVSTPNYAQCFITGGFFHAVDRDGLCVWDESLETLDPKIRKEYDEAVRAAPLADQLAAAHAELQYERREKAKIKAKFDKLDREA